MLSDGVFKGMNAVHRSLLKLTGGRSGWTFMKMPVVELTTTGRTSGAPRSVMLTVPVQEGDTLVIVASKGGEDRHPAWYVNLQAHPEVTVRRRDGAPVAMRARVADAAERARLWPRVTEAYKGYAGYQQKTDREIPVVLLEPAP